MLKLATAALKLLPPADDVSAEDLPAPPTAAERLRADLDAAKPASLQSAEVALRLARRHRADASEAYTGAIQAAIAAARSSRESKTPAEVVAERALADADGAIDAPLSRLQSARESAAPKIRAAAVPHLTAAAEKLNAAAAAIGEVREILQVCSRFAAENGMASAHWPNALPSPKALKDLADRLARGVM